MGDVIDARTIGFGFWGAGAVADLVVQDLRLVPGARLQTVAARREEAARGFGARHGAARCGTGLASLLGDDRVDVVYIATPNAQHAADCIACLEAGKAVLCEKPFATCAADAERIAAAARRHGRFCMEAMWSRFVPALAAARAAIAGGTLGPLRLLQGSFAYANAFDAASRLFDPAQGGGALLDRGVYLVSLAQQWLGEPDVVHAGAVIGASGVDEHCSVQLTWRQGVIADFVAGLRVRGSNELVVAGEQATLRLPAPFYRAHRLELRHTDAAPTASAARSEGWRAALRSWPWLAQLRRQLDRAESPGRVSVQRFAFPGHGYQFQLAEVVRCVHEGRLESPTMPLADSVAVLRTLDRARACWTR
jgi:predicted dehydrogenase